MSDLELRMEKLEQRVHELQDRVDLHEIMARYGPAVDSGSADAAAPTPPRCGGRGHYPA